MMQLRAIYQHAVFNNSNVKLSRVVLETNDTELPESEVP
jgi:hypothetical protein